MQGRPQHKARSCSASVEAKRSLARSEGEGGSAQVQKVTLCAGTEKGGGREVVWICLKSDVSKRFMK